MNGICSEYISQRGLKLFVEGLSLSTLRWAAHSKRKLAMPPTILELETHNIVSFEIFDDGALSDELILGLGQTFDYAEDSNRAAVILRIFGQEDPAALTSWPGQTNIQMVSRWERLLRRI